MSEIDFWLMQSFYLNSVFVKFAFKNWILNIERQQQLNSRPFDK
jgi:hypothetical protein